LEIWSEKGDCSIGFTEKRRPFRRKLAKMAESSDENWRIYRLKLAKIARKNRRKLAKNAENWQKTPKIVTIKVSYRSSTDLSLFFEMCVGKVTKYVKVTWLHFCTQDSSFVSNEFTSFCVSYQRLT
jgi:hypothetical protein